MAPPVDGHHIRGTESPGDARHPSGELRAPAPPRWRTPAFPNVQPGQRHGGVGIRSENIPGRWDSGQLILGLAAQDDSVRTVAAVVVLATASFIQGSREKWYQPEGVRPGKSLAFSFWRWSSCACLWAGGKDQGGGGNEDAGEGGSQPQIPGGPGEQGTRRAPRTCSRNGKTFSVCILTTRKVATHSTDFFLEGFPIRPVSWYN